MTMLPLLLLAPLLAVAAYTDLRMMRIPNVLPLAALALFGACALFAPPPDLLGRAIAAAVVFAIGYAGFAARMFGGGDVKMLAAMTLFIPVASLPFFAYALSAGLLLGIALVLGLRRLPAMAQTGWKSMTVRRGFPMGVSMALAGWIHTVTLAILTG